MTELADRQKHFDQSAGRLIETIIRPRLQVLASHFSNAGPLQGDASRQVLVWFGYCERFPASTSVSFTVEHDVGFTKASVLYEARMIPTFIRFDEHDKWTVDLDALEETSVANWVEERLLEFVDVYLQIDRGPDDDDEDTATDPVCGMRIGRTNAVATGDFAGHLYYFCSNACQAQFARDPTKFVCAKPM
jgi:YHS domain-containing protein